MPVQTEPRVNPLQEQSLLDPAALARWQGFPLEWVIAQREVSAGRRMVDISHLAMLDTGRARADFGVSQKDLSFDLADGSIGLFATGTEVRHCRWWCSDSVRRIMVLLDFNRVCDGALAQSLRETQHRTTLEFHDTELTAVLRCMAQEVAVGCPNGGLYAQSLSLGVAMRLQGPHAKRWVDSAERGKLSRNQAQRINECIGANLGADLSLNVLAQEAGFSPAQFVRLFKNTFGCTPHQHVLQARVKRAEELVQNTNMPLSAIADEVGFASQSHMTAVFARLLGTSPGLRRREGRRNPPR